MLIVRANDERVSNTSCPYLCVEWAPILISYLCTSLLPELRRVGELVGRVSYLAATTVGFAQEFER